MLYLRFGYFEKFLKIVFRDNLVPLADAAVLAFVEEDVFAMLHLHAHGLHHPLAGVLPVAGVVVHVAAPQALRAVVGIAVAFDLLAAMAADEVFNCAGESFAHNMIINSE